MLDRAPRRALALEWSEGERILGQVEEALTRDLAGEDAAARRRMLREIASRSG